MINLEMTHQKHSTDPTRKKNAYCRHSKRHTLKNDVFLYILLIFLLKIEKARLQSTSNQNENISKGTSDNSNSPPNFSLSDEAAPTKEQQATEITSISSPSNSIPKSPTDFKKSISKTDDLKLNKIEPSDYSNMMNIQSLDVGKSGDSFIGPRMKTSNWAPNGAQDSKHEKKLVPELSTDSSKPITDETSQEPYYEIAASSETKSKDDFCKKNISQISFSDIEGVESDTDEEANPSKLNTPAQMSHLQFPMHIEDESKEAEKMTECIAKKFNHDGIVCVCNKTYCDKLLPIELPQPGKFIWYQSSKDGDRFRRTDGQLSKFTNHVKVKDSFSIQIEDSFKQTFIGYGGGFSDSASSNIESLSQQTRRHLMRSYYGEFGLEYNIGRVPIGGTDFSPRFYTYMDTEEKFVLSEQDFKYKIPALHEAIEIIHDDLMLVGCSWTAPKWMKTNSSHFNGELKREYYQSYADYHVKFLDHYAKNGIKFWALSTGNQPLTAYTTTEPPFINGMEWSPYKQSKWLTRNLQPTLDASGYSHIELIVGDENIDMIMNYASWFFNPLRGEKCYETKPWWLTNEAFNITSGISLHGYHDSPENAVYLSLISNMFIPEEKFIILGETACTGKPQLGAWDCAERYAQQMINYFRRASMGFIDRNLALDMDGGPTYLNNFLDAAIIVNTEKDEFYKQPMYYVIAHFSKFIIPRSRTGVRILPSYNSTSTGIAIIAASRPDGTEVIVAYNRSPKMQNIVFYIDDEYQFSLNISAKSINSVIFTLPEHPEIIN